MRFSDKMEMKSQNPINHLNKKTTHDLIEFYFEINHLKQLFRQGWLRNVPKDQCESVAAHSFGTSLLAMVVGNEYFPEVDTSKAMQMALIHDLGEVYAGDFIPNNKINKKEKHELEKKSILQLFSKLKKGKKYIELWEEFEAGKTKEAKFVKQMDKLEMVLQASVYEHKGYKNLQEFFDSSKSHITDEKLKELFNEIEPIRNNKQ
ncbi:MAG: HD domain-containing protein [Candidatus Diapherotrites archaeon]|nr:HD domain-containing protein [Candidatus Diapherotrites archaeon]